MLDFLGASQNVLFSAAIVLMLLIGAVQLVGFGHFDVDADADLDGDLLAWLGVGRLPLLMLLVVFLASFGIIGLIGQQASHDWLGVLQPLWIAAPVAAIAALPVTGLAARLLARILPSDFTTAVPIEDMVGRGATIVVGRAEQGSPARARVTDQFGQAHYVMVEPDTPDQVFEEGEAVLLVRQQGAGFRAITRGDHRLPYIDG
ncbi:YqiJ family protein [Sphingomonas donggukensis]|uniref:YqiJ family protein n=1 Tax=Sphingomonas donggukensis TaxID=2949093 RepID=A0ABY4TUH6_9SPHN|nr:YqiJ family protein [Sphingomonas donggukensis]URW76065.1 YqiJ family protein [Sphingomonas donggukensis]